MLIHSPSYRKLIFSLSRKTTQVKKEKLVTLTRFFFSFFFLNARRSRCAKYVLQIAITVNATDAVFLTQVSHNCDLFQIRREYGCYDEVFFSNYSLNKRQCNWIRFLRIVQSYDEQVNLIGTKVKGELMYASKEEEKRLSKSWESTRCSKW